MTNNIDLNKKLDEILEELNYLGMVIKNLKDREGKPIVEAADVDERLFGDIATYEILTEELKKGFLMLLMLDAKRLVDACSSNTDILGKASESLRKIENLIDSLNKHETEDINKSKALQALTTKAKTKLNEIKRHMNKIISEKKEYEKQQDLQQKIRRYSG